MPEPLFGRPALKALSFTERVRADHWSFGGNVGYDYEIYAPPRLPDVPGAFTLDLTGQHGAEYLGIEWGGADQGGRLVPAGGATIYVPPRAASRATLTLDVVGPVNEPALIMSDAGDRVPLPQLSAPGPQRLQVPVRLAAGGRSTELRLAPARRNTAVRVLRVRWIDDERAGISAEWMPELKFGPTYTWTNAASGDGPDDGLNFGLWCRSAVAGVADLKVCATYSVADLKVCATYSVADLKVCATYSVADPEGLRYVQCGRPEGRRYVHLRNDAAARSAFRVIPRASADGSALVLGVAYHRPRSTSDAGVMSAIRGVPA